MTLFSIQSSNTIPTLWKNFLIGLFLLLGLALETQAQSINSVIKDRPVIFRANSPQASNFTWTFPEGTKNGPVVEHSFTTPGSQEVSLQVSDRNGNQNQITKSILVRNFGRPTAIATITINGETASGTQLNVLRSQSITFTSTSLDENGGSEVDLSWVVNGTTIGSDNLITQTFNRLGTNSVKLIASKRGNSNIRDEKTFTIGVQNAKPIIESLTATLDPTLGAQKIDVTTTAEDPDGTIIQYRFEVLENGVVRAAQISEQSATTFNLNQFPGDHDYFFRVTAFDSDGGQAVKTTESATAITSTFQNAAPKVSIFPSPGNTGTTATNFSLFAQGADSDGDFLTYEWTFPNEEKKFGSHVNHRFTEIGDHTVTLKVSDSSEEVETSMTFKIAADPNSPEILAANNHAPLGEIRGVFPGTGGDTNTLFAFYAQGSDVDQDRLQYEWDFGNGQRAFVQNVSQKYLDPGDYNVKLTVSDGLATDEKQIVINVVNPGEEIPPNNPLNDTNDLRQDLSNELANSQEFGLKPSASGIARESAVAQLNQQREAQIIALQNETDPERQQELQIEIEQLEKKINFIENDLPSSIEKQQQLQTALDEKNGALQSLSSQIANLDEAIAAEADPQKRTVLQNNKAKLESEKSTLESNLEAITQEIEIIEKRVFQFITISGTTDTTFFLYGKAPINSPRAILFEWDLGDGRQHIGQNVGVKYTLPGIYKVQLFVSDSSTTVSDWITIEVKEK